MQTLIELESAIWASGRSRKRILSDTRGQLIKNPVFGGNFAQLVERKLAPLVEEWLDTFEKIRSLKEPTRSDYPTTLVFHEAMDSHFETQRHLVESKPNPYAIVKPIRNLIYDSPETLTMLPPELTAKILKFLLISDRVKMRHIREFYEVFHRGVNGTGHLRAQSQAHCDALQTVIADLQISQIRDEAGRGLSLTYIFGESPAALAKIGPGFLSERLKKHKNDAREESDWDRQSFFDDIAKDAEIVIAQNPHDTERNLDEYFEPFGIAARIVTSRRTAHLGNLTVVVSSERGVYIRYPTKYPSFLPLAEALDKMMWDEDDKNSALYDRHVIPTLIKAIYNLQGKKDTIFAQAVINAEKVMEEKLGRKNDHFIRKAYRHFYPVAIS